MALIANRKPRLRQFTRTPNRQRRQELIREVELNVPRPVADLGPDCRLLPGVRGAEFGTDPATPTNACGCVC